MINRRLRVLHIGKFYPPHKGGMETHLHDLCHAISPYVDVEVISASNTRHSVTEKDGIISVRRIGTWKTVASAPICPGMVNAIRSTPADLIHIHVPNPTAVLALLASGHCAPIVVTYQSDIVRQRFLSHVYDPFDRVFLRRADAIVCLSPNYIESSPVLAPHRPKCHAIPHGINLDRFESPDVKAVSRVRSRYGPRLILAVGRLVYYKGFEILIRAMRGIDANLLIVGSGPLRDHLFTVAGETGVSEQVHFLGEVPDVVSYYHAARMFVLPSVARSEAFGIVQLEAMGCGTPVINTDLDSGVPFVSLHNASGLTVPPADVAALRSAMQCLLADDHLHHRFSVGARRRVLTHFSVEQMASRTLELYDSVLGRKMIPAEVTLRDELTPEFTD
jgi:glycosyltransferase involved in cell wall biosynthesis